MFVGSRFVERRTMIANNKQHSHRPHRSATSPKRHIFTRFASPLPCSRPPVECGMNNAVADACARRTQVADDRTQTADDVRKSETIVRKSRATCVSRGRLSANRGRRTQTADDVRRSRTTVRNLRATAVGRRQTVREGGRRASQRPASYSPLFGSAGFSGTRRMET